MPSGTEMLALAEQHIGEQYVNVLVPKNDPNWRGPWDCAEFMSWLVYQTAGYLYGCTSNRGHPASTEAYTGAWKNDSARLGIRMPWREAAAVKGAVLLRYPPAPGRMGHIVVSDGRGGTVEAMGARFGVCHGRVDGRAWDTGVLLPEFTYEPPTRGLDLQTPTRLYGLGRPGMSRQVIKTIQRALTHQGFSPGPVDGKFGRNTTAAVAAFQATKGLVPDGEVGSQTANELGVDLEV